jgi:hypothetical protein
MLIYALIDPRNGERRYIGQTTRTAHRRLRRHLARCYLDNADTHNNRWLRQLLALGLEPRIEVLERCDSLADLSAAERRHIAGHRATGARLTNLTPGGDGGGHPHTPKSRQKIRMALTGKKKSAQHRLRVIAAVTGRKASPATRMLMSNARKGKNPHPWWTEADRLKMRDAKGGRPFVDQHGIRYETIKGAARLLGLEPGHICQVLRGKRQSHGGYTFHHLRVREFPA